MEESFSVEQLADLLNLSRSQLHRKLIALTGQAPNRLIRTFRLKKAYDQVSIHAATISEIAFGVGFGSPLISLNVL
jgi:AraC-like DNA-binding protein